MPTTAGPKSDASHPEAGGAGLGGRFGEVHHHRSGGDVPVAGEARGVPHPVLTVVPPIHRRHRRRSARTLPASCSKKISASNGCRVTLNPAASITSTTYSTDASCPGVPVARVGTPSNDVRVRDGLQSRHVFFNAARCDRGSQRAGVQRRGRHRRRRDRRPKGDDKRTDQQPVSEHPDLLEKPRQPLTARHRSADRTPPGMVPPVENRWGQRALSLANRSISG